jgi:CheY-like chemotaxis protein
MSELQTATVETTDLAPASAIALPLALVADPDAASRARRADQLQERGFRVVLARTPFEAIVKASCLLPDLILLASSFGRNIAAETAELLTGCPATSHIPIVRLATGRRVPSRVLTLARC